MKCPNCGHVIAYELYHLKKSELQDMLGDELGLTELKRVRDDGSYYYDGISDTICKSTLVLMITKIKELKGEKIKK